MFLLLGGSEAGSDEEDVAASTALSPRREQGGLVYEAITPQSSPWSFQCQSSSLPQPGAALTHFGRDGKDADTCFFCLGERFFSHFLLFFASMSPDFAYCVTCF